MRAGLAGLIAVLLLAAAGVVAGHYLVILMNALDGSR